MRNRSGIPRNKLLSDEGGREGVWATPDAHMGVAYGHAAAQQGRETNWSWYGLASHPVASVCSEAPLPAAEADAGRRAWFEVCRTDATIVLLTTAGRTRFACVRAAFRKPLVIASSFARVSIAAATAEAPCKSTRCSECGASGAASTEVPECSPSRSGAWSSWVEAPDRGLPPPEPQGELLRPRPQARQVLTIPESGKRNPLSIRRVRETESERLRHCGGRASPKAVALALARGAAASRYVVRCQPPRRPAAGWRVPPAAESRSVLVASP